MENLSDRKKILLVTRPIAPPWDEGSKNFAFYLAKNISALDFYLLTNGLIPDLPPHIKQKPIYTSNKLTYMQRVRLLKLRHLLREDFDVIHYMLTPTKLNAFSFKKLVGHKNARTIQTIATLREDLFKDKDFKNILFADLIITYSDHAKNKLNSIGFNNVKRVYPGIDLEKYRYAPKDNSLMAKKNIQKDDFVINFTGEYTRNGAIDLVIDSFIEISKDIPEARLALAVRIKNEKDARKKKEVVKILEEKKLSDRVSFFDDGKYEMEKVYNLCDISLFPVSDMKGKFDVPLAVIEAMACSKPMIITDLKILQEFTNTDNSLVIPKGSKEALVAAIKELKRDKSKRDSIGSNARRYVEENFDIRNIADIYRKIYEVI